MSAAELLPGERKSQASAREAEPGARRPPPLPPRKPAGVRGPRRPPRVPVCAQPGAAPSLRARRALRAARTAARAAARPPPWAGLSQNSPAPGERPRAPPRAAERRGERPEAGPPPASGGTEKAGARGGPGCHPAPDRWQRDPSRACAPGAILGPGPGF
ncbi:uncharacterized protein RBU33_027971 [Hipposideros larvatus]